MGSADQDLLPEGATDYLARGAQSGDVAAFCALYERVAPAVYSWARLRIAEGLRASIGPEDIVQEVWLRAMGSLTSSMPSRGPSDTGSSGSPATCG